MGSYGDHQQKQFDVENKFVVTGRYSQLPLLRGSNNYSVIQEGSFTNRDDWEGEGIG